MRVWLPVHCGRLCHAVQESSCPQCHKTIGGTEFATRNNKRLDKQAQQGQVHGEAGYITHAASRDRQQSVRLLAPLPFRALHFLLHSALLGSLFRGAASLSLSRILEHLEADWHVLHTALNGSPQGNHQQGYPRKRQRKETPQACCSTCRPAPLSTRRCGRRCQRGMPHRRAARTLGIADGAGGRELWLGIVTVSTSTNICTDVEL